MHRIPDVAATIWLELDLWVVVPFDNTELTYMSLSGHLVDIEGQVLVHQTEMNRLSLIYNALWWQRAVPSTDIHTTFTQY